MSFRSVSRRRGISLWKDKQPARAG